MKIKLYLDDRRPLPDESYTLVRSYDEAIKFVEDNGIPTFISFDHDLGCDDKGNILKDGYDFAKWLIEMDMDGVHNIPDNFSFFVHSSNPSGKQNIASYLSNYLKHKRGE